MHEIIQLDLGDSLWKSDGTSTLTVGIWTPYDYQDLKEIGRFYFLIVSDRAAFSERIFQNEPEKVKIELVEHLRNNYPHFYLMKEKIAKDNDSQKRYIGDFRTMKPFLTMFRELETNELNEFVKEFILLTECRNQSEKADFLVSVLDANSSIHYKLANKLKELHEKSAAAEKRIAELIHQLKQNTFQNMSIELLEQLEHSERNSSDTESETNFREIAERDYNDPVDFSTTDTEGLKAQKTDYKIDSPTADDYTEPLLREKY